MSRHRAAVPSGAVTSTASRPAPPGPAVVGALGGPKAPADRSSGPTDRAGDARRAGRRCQAEVRGGACSPSMPPKAADGGRGAAANPPLLTGGLRQLKDRSAVGRPLFVGQLGRVDFLTISLPTSVGTQLAADSPLDEVGYSFAHSTCPASP